ncbi:MAG: hypothetical protein RI897_1981 [Verrucomicrobiota bacterium]
MAEVGVAAGAEDFGAAHAVAEVGLGADVFLGKGLEEAGPAGAGIEFGISGEEGEVAADAGVNAGFFVVVESAAEGAFRAFAAGDDVLFGSELLAPFGVGFDDFVLHLEVGGASVFTGEPDFNGF